MDDLGYLIGHGRASEFGRFRSPGPRAYRRGDRVVVQTQRGLEVGRVLCPATPRHAQMLADAWHGQLVRPVNPEDERRLNEFQERSQTLFEECQRWTAELGLPLTILDVELLFDGKQAILEYVSRSECDLGPLLDAITARYCLRLEPRNLTAAPEANGHGCGRPDCGGGAGGCDTCTTGGCGSGCGSPDLVRDVQSFFAGLRQNMEAQHRTPLL